MRGIRRPPGFGVPALAAAGALAVGLPACWAVWMTPGRLGTFLEIDAQQGGRLITLQLGRALTGAWSTGQWVVGSGLLVGLVALAVVAFTSPAPRTRPAPRVLGAVLITLGATLTSVLLARLVPQLSTNTWFVPVLFPIALFIGPPAALCSPRYASVLGLCTAVAAAGAVVMSGTRAVPAPLPVPDLVLAVTLLAGALVAAAGGARARHPAQLVTGGLLVGGAQALAMLAAMYLVMSGDALPNFGEVGGTLGLGVAVGAGQGLLLRLSLPLFERWSARLSAVSLARWADPQHPLLVRLKREAPGTFHHSQSVGEMAARAAAAVGGDATIARVGGYYHDIGKIRRPDAFGENTPDTCHRELAPGESASLILAHVRDGSDLAEEYGVPAVIRAYIVEHHGTTTVEFFYNKAKERALKGEGSNPRRADYTYAGPRPQTLESALVMLADSAEASSRSLDNPSVAELRDIVEKIYRNKLGAFQFDECPATHAELAEAREVFVAELAASRHTRPQYPDTEYPTQAIDKKAVQAAAGDARA